jgi:hypothetical protein
MPKRSPKNEVSKPSPETKPESPTPTKVTLPKRTSKVLSHKATIREGDNLEGFDDEWNELIDNLKRLSPEQLRAAIVTVAVIHKPEAGEPPECNTKILSFTAGEAGDLATALMITNQRVANGIREIAEATGEHPNRVTH